LTVPGAPPDLDRAALRWIELLLDALATLPGAPSTVTDRAQARDVHIADSLSGLSFSELREARSICDLGAGAGFPGLVLAAAMHESGVHLLESITRKCEFMRAAATAAGIENATVVDDRAETWALGAGAERFDLVTARAVGRLSTLAELASPLLAPGGHLLAWKGRRDADEEAELGRAAEELAMAPQEVRWVGPYAGSRNRHLHLIRKSGPTPAGLPRRPGMAKKRPRGRA
jgi:16S rRNA (guanine527-N7)-methyltransferase